MPGWLVILIVILCVLAFMTLINPTGPCHGARTFATTDEPPMLVRNLSTSTRRMLKF